MSPRTRRKTTKKRSRRSKKNAFWSYLIILLLAIIVGASTYFLLNHFYHKSDKNGEQTIENIDRYLDKQKQQSVDKNSQNRENLSAKPEKKDVVKFNEPKNDEAQKKSNLKPKVTLKELNLTDEDEDEIKLPKSLELNLTKNSSNETKSQESNLTQNSVKIDAAEQNTSKKDSSKQKPKVTKSAKSSKSGKPKLVIIIDDVAYKHQVDAIKSINLNITPSIFPATKEHPDTPNLAKQFKFYIIHLPMQAYGYSKEIIGTLRVNDGSEKILKKLKEIKRDFPNVKYMNNHTGSKFTSDFDAMDRLIGAMKGEGLTFIDSKTIANTKAQKAAQKHSMPYIARDVFLDHEDSKSSIRKQLKYAVNLAKKRSYAIAIGHPYKNTIWVLKNSQDILDEVEVVFLRDVL